jgi:ankyrin repeat protein
MMKGGSSGSYNYFSNPSSYNKNSYDGEDRESAQDRDSFNQTSEPDHFPEHRNEGRQIFDLLETGTNEEIYEWIENLLSQYKIDQIVNNNGLGLLHVAWQNDNLELVHFIIEKAHDMEGKKYVKMLVNMKWRNRDMSFTPLHFWAYNGNVAMLNFLINNEASLLIPNDQGVRALHVAAQGDQAAMINYLINKMNWNIEEKDSNGNTALHWAIFTGSEHSTAFLLALGADPNSTNHENSYPLHLAIKSVEDHGSIRNVKALLLSGALRNLRDCDK